MNQNEATRLPLYRSHKLARATKITEVYSTPTAHSTTGGVSLNTEHGLIPVGEEWAKKHQPVAGGYFVKYEEGDGYESYTPAEPFESGWTRVPVAGSGMSSHSGRFETIDGTKLMILSCQLQGTSGVKRQLMLRRALEAVSNIIRNTDHLTDEMAEAQLAARPTVQKSMVDTLKSDQGK